MILTKDKELIKNYLKKLEYIIDVAEISIEQSLNDDDIKALSFAVAYIKDRENIK